MNTQNGFTSVAPYAGLAGVVAEIISPVANLIASGVIVGVQKLANAGTRSKRPLSRTPAKNETLFLVPGNFMATPFSYR